ncbi:MAG: DUF1731 domain-containing protein [Bacteroidota bacterium]
MNKHIVITGGTGYIGLTLASYLEEAGYTPILVSRNEPSFPIPRGNTRGAFTHFTWDARTPEGWGHCLEGCLAIVNLAGRTVDCIKTPDHCDEILRSRVESTQAIGKALKRIANPPKVWIQMSTAHIYGDPPKLWCDEEAAFGYGLAPTVGKAWEAAFHESALPGMRKVILRTSFVLGKEGGALPQLAQITRFGLGGKVGSGKQGVSWIHETDLNRLIRRAIEDGTTAGAYISSAPNPVSYSDFMKTLRKTLKVPFGLPAAAWMVRLATKLVFRTDPDLVLYGRYCVSKRLKQEGFNFLYPELGMALSEIYSGKS